MSRSSNTIWISTNAVVAFEVRVYTVFSFFVFKFANEKRIPFSFFVFKCSERKTKNEFLFRFQICDSKQLRLFIAKIIVTNTWCHHVYNINTSRTTWKHCHVYRVNRGFPHGYMLVTHCHWSKNAMWRNLHGKSNGRPDQHCMTRARKTLQ